MVRQFCFVFNFYTEIDSKRLCCVCVPPLCVLPPLVSAGDDKQRARARDYVQYVTQQRIGPVHIDLTSGSRDDLVNFLPPPPTPDSPPLLQECACLRPSHCGHRQTVVDVPEDCVGFVMGRGGNTLRSMEEEWGSLMFFAQAII